MSTATASQLVPVASASMWFATRVLDGIGPDIFARKPKGVDCSSPAFIIGHLSLYPDKILELIGRGELAKPDERFTKLFEGGAECKDDPNGTIYPSMDEIVTHFRTRYELLIGQLDGIDPALLDQPNPVESRRELLPTLGAMITFLLTGHMMMHLGQISTWRRCMGLGPCM